MTREGVGGEHAIMVDDDYGDDEYAYDNEVVAHTWMAVMPQGLL